MNLKKMLFEKNESNADRIIRVVVGAILVVAFTQSLVSGWLNYIVLLLGIIGLYTGIMGHCLIYSLFGYSTRK